MFKNLSDKIVMN